MGGRHALRPLRARAGRARQRWRTRTLKLCLLRVTVTPPGCAHLTATPCASLDGRCSAPRSSSLTSILNSRAAQSCALILSRLISSHELDAVLQPGASTLARRVCAPTALPAAPTARHCGAALRTASAAAAPCGAWSSSYMCLRACYQACACRCGAAFALAAESAKPSLSRRVRHATPLFARSLKFSTALMRAFECLRRRYAPKYSSRYPSDARR